MTTTDIADCIPGRGRIPARRRVAAAAACTLAVLTAIAGCGSAPPTLASAAPTSTSSTGPTSSVATSADATVPAGPSASVDAEGSGGPRAQAGPVAPGGSGGPVPAGPATPPGPVVTTGAGSRSDSAPQAPNTLKPNDPPQAGGGSSAGSQPPVKQHTIAPQPPRGGVGSPAGSNGSEPVLASPIRVPLPTDSISSQPFETAKTRLEPQILAACGDGSLCVQVAAKADPDAGPGQECVGSAENTDFDGDGAGTVTVPRHGTIFLLIDAFCSNQPVALAWTNVEHFS